MQHTLTASEWNDEGERYYDNGDYVNAMIAFNRAIELNPKFDDAYNSRGLVLLKQKYFGAAIGDFTYAITLNPNFAAAYYNRGSTYYDQGQKDLAIADFTKAIQLDTAKFESCSKGKDHQDEQTKLSQTLASAHYFRGCVYDTQGKLPEALADLDRAIKLDPNCAKYYIGRGFLFYQQRKLSEAIADYYQALELDPGHELTSIYLEKLLFGIKPEDDLSGLANPCLLMAIKKLSKEKQITLLKRCLDKNTELGKRMWTPRDPSSPCSLEKDTLNDICDHLLEIDPTFIMQCPLKRILIHYINKYAGILGKEEKDRVFQYRTFIEKKSDCSDEELFKLVHQSIMRKSPQYYGLHCYLADKLSLYLLLRADYNRDDAEKLISTGVYNIRCKPKKYKLKKSDEDFLLSVRLALLECFKPKPYCKFKLFEQTDQLKLEAVSEKPKENVILSSENEPFFGL